jgi:hypothetical protein
MRKRLRKNVSFIDVYKYIVIHMQNNRNSIKNDLYTKLYTLSTVFLCKSAWFIMVTFWTSVLYSSHKFKKYAKKNQKSVDFFEVKNI